MEKELRQPPDDGLGTADWMLRKSHWSVEWLCAEPDQMQKEKQMKLTSKHNFGIQHNLMGRK